MPGVPPVFIRHRPNLPAIARSMMTPSRRAADRDAVSSSPFRSIPKWTLEDPLVVDARRVKDIKGIGRPVICCRQSADRSDLMGGPLPAAL